MTLNTSILCGYVAVAISGLSMSLLLACGNAASGVSAVADVSSSFSSAYGGYVAMPENVRADLTSAVGTLTFQQLGHILGNPSIASIGGHYPTVQAFLSSVQAKPASLSIKDFAAAMDGKADGHSANGRRLQAEVAVNMSIMALLARIDQKDAKAQKTAGLNLVAKAPGPERSVCEGIPSSLKDAIDWWVVQPNADTTQYNYSVTSGTPKGTSVLKSQSATFITPRLIYHARKYGTGPDADSQEVVLTGKPSDATVTLGKSSGGYDNPTPLSQCQTDRIHQYLNRAANGPDPQAMAHAIATYWQGASGPKTQ